MSLVIEYELFGTGWSTCRLRADGQEAELTASYLSDALGNLAAAAVLLLEGLDEVRFSFDEEPGEFRWILLARFGDLDIRILQFDQLWGEQPDNEGRLIFQTSCPVSDFAAAVINALRVLLDKYGIDGYRERWVDAPFPAKELAQLERMSRA